MAFIDGLEGSVSIIEEAGLVREVRAVGRFKGTMTSVASAGTSVLSSVDVPAVGATLTINSQVVVLEDRTVDVVDGKWADVELVYRRQESSDFTFRVTTSLEQISSQLDGSGTQITVAHNGITQGGTINVLDPVSTLEVELVTASASPGGVAKDWVGHVNSATWQGGAAGTWLCTSVTADPVDQTAATPKFRFRFEFQYRADGWQPQVVFIDPETGEPPAGLVANTGYKTVTWHPTKNFGATF